MKKTILLLTLFLDISSSCIVNAALPVISKKDQKSILSLINNIKSLLKDVLQEIKAQKFSNKPNAVSDSIPENIKNIFFCRCWQSPEILCTGQVNVHWREICCAIVSSTHTRNHRKIRHAFKFFEPTIFKLEGKP